MKNNSIIKVGFVFLLMMMPSLAAVQFDSVESTQTVSNGEEIEYSMFFSQPVLVDGPNEEKSIEIDEVSNHDRDSNGYVLPCETKVFTFPLGTQILSVECQHSEPRSIPIEYKISSTSPYPSDIVYARTSDDWYEWKTGGGISDGEHVQFLVITCYPVKYNPDEKYVRFIDHFDFSIQYDENMMDTVSNDQYDLVILSPSSFKSSLSTLVDHKNDHGINTISITLDDIYNDIYFPVDGFDRAEEIKQFLYQAFSQWGIDYVLLVGDINKLPIRSTWMGTGTNEMSALTDLYYADLCFGNGSFCSWDSNHNGIYGETWHGTSNDLVDLYPDINVGRLACSTNRDVQSVVEKIITYEDTAFGSDWADTFILAGGDTHTGMNDYPEGELLIENIKNLTSELNHIMLKTSDGSYTAESLNEAIDTGAGYFCYAGHGFEIGLSTHPPNSDDWVDYTLLDLFNLKNEGKYPIMFFDACLTARLDYNIANLIADLLYFSLPLPKLDKRDDITFPILFPCIAWEMVAKPHSGAVATIGATRVAYSMINQNGDVGFGCGILTQNFFSSLANSTYLSDSLVNAQNLYLEKSRYDPFTLQEFILLGDPTLRIGGYE